MHLMGKQITFIQSKWELTQAVQQSKEENSREYYTLLAGKSKRWTREIAKRFLTLLRSI